MKKVYSKPPIEEFRLTKDADNEAIYIFKTKNVPLLYKAHQCGDCWQFIALDNSVGYWDTESTLTKLLDSASSEGEIFEFQTIREFSDWLSAELSE